MAELSVIVPIYKVEKYLQQCLDSIVNQTFQDLEIILVDDGSPDKCGKICDEYAKRDSRIRVLHKENEGLPSARNDGINMATGKWIAFVDSDDWLELDIYEHAIEAGDKYDVDILLFNHFRNIGSKEIEVSFSEKDCLVKDRPYIKSMSSFALCRFMSPMKKIGYEYPWNRIIKRKFVEENNLYFEKTQAYEDTIYAIKCFQNARSISFIQNHGYHYRLNEKGISTGYKSNRIEIDKTVFEEMFRLAKIYNVDENYYRSLYAFIVNNVAVNTTRYFFNKQNKKNFINKMRYAASVIKEEPYYTAFDKVDRSLLTSGGHAITIFRHYNVILLYFCYLCKKIKEIL